MWFSYKAVSIKGLKIDIMDVGDHDNGEEDHDSDPPNSNDDEYDRALTVAERVAISDETNDDEAGPMETVVDAEVVDAYMVDAEVVVAAVSNVINLCSDDEL